MRGRALDARKEEDITAFLREADAAAPLEVCIFNVGANVNFPLLETTERVFRKVWEMACYAGFLTGREAARLMLPRGRGHASSSPARPPACAAASAIAAFASAKFGLRAVAQSMARELGPKNIHVAHLVIDAGVDTAFVRERIERERRRGAGSLEPDQLMNPASIAEAYWQLHRQPRDAWTHRAGPAALRRRSGEMAQGRIPFRFRQPQRLSGPPGHPGDRAAHRREVRLRAGPARRRLQATNNRSPAESLRAASRTSWHTSSWRRGASSRATASPSSARTRFSRSTRC